MSEDRIGFLGQGISFPPRLDPTTGRFMMCSGDKDIRESIYIILMTKLYERAMLPQFGSDINKYVFNIPDVSFLNMLQDDIIHALIQWEPRITDIVVEIGMEEANEGKIVIQIDYIVRITNSPDNLVFPYYMYEGGHGDE